MSMLILHCLVVTSLLVLRPSTTPPQYDAYFIEKFLVPLTLFGINDLSRQHKYILLGRGKTIILFY